jgi:uncharacterized protein YbaP (TraB family)
MLSLLWESMMFARSDTKFRCVIVLFGLCSIAPVSISKAAAQADSGKHCVWRVTNLSASFYLVGSIHNLRGHDYPLAPVYRTALRDSQRLLFEYNPRERDAYTSKFRAAGTYPQGDDIRNHIHQQTLALLVKNLSTAHIHFDDVKHYKPWALAFRVWIARRYAAAAGTHGVDEYLSYQAQRLGKEVAGLETVDEHVAFWKDMLEFDGENLLLYAMMRTNRLNDRLDETRAAWKRGDIAALSATNARLRDKNFPHRPESARPTEWEMASAYRS